MAFNVARTILAAALVPTGTFKVDYPAGTSAGTYFGAVDHKIATGPGDVYVSPDNFTLTFGAADITITSVNMSIPAGTQMYVQLDIRGQNDGKPDFDRTIQNVFPAGLAVINLGSPATADADGYVESQNLTDAGVFSGDGMDSGALAGKADKPRNVVASWTSTAVLTVTGKDQYGNTVVESSGSGTSLTGKKAFAEVTGVSVSANVTALTVGTGVLLGLPVFLPNAGMVLKELMDGAAATAGTLAAGVDTVPTATTGDVRGTYSPNSEPNGSRVYELVCALEDPSYRGRSQFAG